MSYWSIPTGALVRNLHAGYGTYIYATYEGAANLWFEERITTWRNRSHAVVLGRIGRFYRLLLPDGLVGWTNFDNLTRVA